MVNRISEAINAVTMGAARFACDALNSRHLPVPSEINIFERMHCSELKKGTQTRIFF